MSPTEFVAAAEAVADQLEARDTGEPREVLADDVTAAWTEETRAAAEPVVLEDMVDMGQIAADNAAACEGISSMIRDICQDAASEPATEAEDDPLALPGFLRRSEDERRAWPSAWPRRRRPRPRSTPAPGW